MPAKISLICLIHSVNEKDSSNYIIRESTAIIRREENTSMDLRVPNAQIIKNYLLKNINNSQNKKFLIKKKNLIPNAL